MEPLRLFNQVPAAYATIAVLVNCYAVKRVVDPVPKRSANGIRHPDSVQTVKTEGRILCGFN